MRPSLFMVVLESIKDSPGYFEWSDCEGIFCNFVLFAFHNSASMGIGDRLLRQVVVDSLIEFA